MNQKKNKMKIDTRTKRFTPFMNKLAEIPCRNPKYDLCKKLSNEVKLSTLISFYFQYEPAQL